MSSRILIIFCLTRFILFKRKLVWVSSSLHMKRDYAEQDTMSELSPKERTCIYANIKRYDIRRHKSNDIRHELKYQLFYIAGPIAVHTNIFEYYYLFFQHMLWEGNTMRWDCQSFSSDENMFITMEPFWNLDTSMLFYPWFITLYFLYHVDIAQLQGKMQYFVCPMIAIW